MSKFPILLLTFGFLACKSSQIRSADERLYQHVDSLISQVLNYEYSQDSFDQPRTVADTTQVFAHLHLNFPNNPEPRILLDGEFIKKEELRNYNIDKTRTIELMEPGNMVSALFGTMGKNGAIIITTKKFKSKK
ncbi:hypothetical protein [Ekhidna sp.]|uniref:hypothetical protein n=1 Tax=Ekhidna sp. TaxID=2608089 RepID=UPI0032991E01